MVRIINSFIFLVFEPVFGLNSSIVNASIGNGPNSYQFQDVNCNISEYTPHLGDCERRPAPGRCGIAGAICRQGKELIR